jgi:hypothetical protein
MFVKSALTLAIDFGLNLGINRLTMNMGVTISEETIVGRRDCFWSAFASDNIASLYIGRPPSYTPDMIDVSLPPVVSEDDFVEPLYRSSAFHWSSKLMVIASKILATVYSLRPGVSLQARHAVVPELNLLLAEWCVSLIHLLCTRCSTFGLIGTMVSPPTFELADPTPARLLTLTSSSFK